MADQRTIETTASARRLPKARRQQSRSNGTRGEEAAQDKRQGSLTAAYITLSIGGAVVVVPFVWELLTSLKTFNESMKTPPTYIPRTWDFPNYMEVFSQAPFLNMLAVSIGYALLLIIGHVGLGSLAAYAFACLKFPGRDVIFFTLIALLMIPRQLFILPQYEIVQWLGWTNSFWGLVAPHFVGVLAVFLLRQFFLSLPVELTEAAKLDGAGPLRIYFFVLLPLAKPGLIAATILVLIYSWNDLLWPLVILNDDAKMPLTAGLATLQGEFFTDQPVVMAGAVLASLPMILAFLFLQRHFIDGIAFSGGK
jgi:multiple sugar transport system permease protein